MYSPLTLLHACYKALTYKVLSMNLLALLIFAGAHLLIAGILVKLSISLKHKWDKSDKAQKHS